MFTKRERGNSYLNDFSILLPTGLEDGFDWSYSYHMHEWMTEDMNVNSIDLLSETPNILGLGDNPGAKKQND